MEIKEIQDKNYAKTWDNFIIANSSPAAFLQSWSWGEFKSRTQNTDNKTQKMLRYAIYNNNELVAVAQFFKVALPGNKFYLNCPKGPVIKTQNTNNRTREMFNLIKNKIEEAAKQEKIVFFRIAPPYTHKNIEALKHKNTFSEPKILVNLIEPENTLVLNLENSEDEILKNMHQKTRYNIRLAERKNIKINQLSVISDQDVDIFYNLLKRTAQRDKINIFDKDYYKKLLITNYPEHSGLPVTLFIAEYNNTPLSAIIIIGFGNTATYLYGASSDKHRKLMPNYLIQWQAIKWAKSQNYKHYDFWGISKKKEKWAGITRFKQGFVSDKTGREINYVGTFDYILNKKWYNIYRVGKFFQP